MKSFGSAILRLCFLIVLINMGCASDKSAPFMVLDPPPHTNGQVQAYLTEGNRLFREGRWGAARHQFQAAVSEQPDLAEAHYNLALAMDHMGDQAGAKPHFIKAANLAPGNKIIWDSPPLRRYGNVPDAPVEATSNPTIPNLGIGGGGGGPGGGF